jgi:hypothetical protein
LHALTAAGVTGVAISLISLLSFVTFCSLIFLSFFLILSDLAGEKKTIMSAVG